MPDPSAHTVAGVRDAARAGSSERIPVRSLALVTGLMWLVAQLLSRVGGGAGGADGGPWRVVVGQAIWNAAQVGLLLLLLCLWRVRRRWWVAALAIVSVACLPLAIYAISPGAWAFSPLLLATCALAWTFHVPDLGVVIVDAPARGTPTLAKVEFLAVACNLGSSMYNYEYGRGFPPYWAALYRKAAALIGFMPEPPAIAQAMYTLGLDGVSLPPYIRPEDGNPLGSVVFLLIWTVLPFLYVLYFAACANLAKNAYGTRLQQALCLWGVLHFLFLTDIVDYQFGRGIVNPAAEWAHWSERFVWRIAILLPIYQNLVSGHLRRGNGAVGIVLHYAFAVWAVVFLVYMVLIYDLAGFYKFLTGSNVPFAGMLGPYIKLLGYPGALVLMTALYGFMVLAMRCKRAQAQPMAGWGPLTPGRRCPAPGRWSPAATAGRPRPRLR